MNSLLGEASSLLLLYFQVGEWKYTVQSSSYACNARLRIEGFPDTSSPDDEQQPILLTAKVDKVNVNVQKGIQSL